MRPHQAGCHLTRLVVLVLACAALGSSTASGRVRHDADAVIVASFNFTESILVANMYARALQHAGIPVRLETRLGPRELVQPALQQGLVDVVPEYLGTALESLRRGRATTTQEPAAALAQLREALLPWGLQALTPAGAQNQNTFVMRRARAAQLGIKSLTDLARAGRSVVLAGPRECPTRPYCLVGLREVYGLDVRRFVAIEGEAQAVAALEQDVAEVVVMFTTDGALADPELLALEDDQALQPLEHLTPVVSSRSLARYGDRLVSALDAVSRRLTSESLRFLNWRVTAGSRRPAVEARGWLERQAVLPPSG